MATPEFPARSLAECEAILTAPGQAWETETAVIKGRPLKIYKRLPASLREFWESTEAFGPRDYLVYEQDRLTYTQTHARVRQLAAYLQTLGVSKGARVALCLRNSPDWVVAFWAVHTLGAVAVAVNCFNTPDVVAHCVVATRAVVAVVDEERMVALEGWRGRMGAAGCGEVLVVRAAGRVSEGCRCLRTELEGFEASEGGLGEVAIEPEDNATIFFTSGTSGLPKGVLSTQRQFLSNLLNSLVAGNRAVLRAGGDLPVPDPAALQRTYLLPVPLFHVMGCQGALMVTTASAGKLVLLHKWDAPLAARLVHTESITHSGGVPHQVAELIDALALSPSRAHTLEAVSYGGAPAPSTIPGKARALSAALVPAQGYGLTETNAAATTFAGADYDRRPLSCGLPTPVTEVRIVCPETGEVLGVGEVGEVACRGPQVAEGYWENEEATKAAFDAEGWFRSGDLGRVDEEGFLYISDRLKDIIIRGGENIASTLVEDALYLDPRVSQCAVVPVPDAKLGELVAAIVVAHARPGEAAPTEAEIVQVAAKTLPPHAVPVMVLFRDELPRNAPGKVLKAPLKAEAREEWEKRLRGGGLRAKL